MLPISPILAGRVQGEAVVEGRRGEEERGVRYELRGGARRRAEMRIYGVLSIDTGDIKILQNYIKITPKYVKNTDRLARNGI